MILSIAAKLGVETTKVIYSQVVLDQKAVNGKQSLKSHRDLSNKHIQDGTRVCLRKLQWVQIYLSTLSMWEFSLKGFVLKLWQLFLMLRPFFANSCSSK